MYASFRSVKDKNSKILTPTRTGNFLLTSMELEFYTTKQRDIHFLWPPGGSFRNHWTFSVHAVIFFNQSKGLYSEPAFRCFAVTLLYSVTVNELMMRPATHYISKKIILPGLAETNAIHINRNFSAFTTQPLKLFSIFTLMDSVHRRTGNFRRRGAVNHLPKKFLQVAQICTKQSKRNEGHTMQQHTEHRPYWHMKVAPYSFSESIPAKFEHKLRRHKQGFGKNCHHSCIR